jgi:hypothetical protein
MKKKLNGWIVIGICIAALIAAVGVLFLIGQFGPEVIHHEPH